MQQDHEPAIILAPAAAPGGLGGLPGWLGWLLIALGAVALASPIWAAGAIADLLAVIAFGLAAINGIGALRTAEPARRLAAGFGALLLATLGAVLVFMPTTAAALLGTIVLAVIGASALVKAAVAWQSRGARRQAAIVATVVSASLFLALATGLMGEAAWVGIFLLGLDLIASGIALAMTRR